MTQALLRAAYLGAIGCCLYTSGWLMFRAERSRTTKALVMCQLLIIVWCLPQLFLADAPTLAVKYALYGVSYVGISLIGPCWLLFSWFYCGKTVGVWAKLLLFGICAFDYLMFLTNGHHRLFYRYFGLTKVTYGPVFYFHMAYAYVCVVLGMGAVARRFEKRREDGLHTLVLLASAAIPLAFNMVYLSGAANTGFDLTPPVFALSSFLMLLAVFRYDFLDVNVAAFPQIFAAMEEGVVIYNRRGNITCRNQAASGYVHVNPGDRCDRLWEKLCSEDQTYSAAAVKAAAKEGVVLKLPGGNMVQVKHYLLSDRQGGGGAGVILLTNVGEYYELLQKSRSLAVSKQQLAIEQERNRIAQEVHDTTGHTLTMIQSLIKLIRIGLEEEARQGAKADGEIMDYVYQAQELAVGGIRELRWAINHMRQDKDCALVSQGVYHLAGSVRELEIEVEIQGEDGPQYSHLSQTVFSCLREAITNCLKYAGASHMDVIVKFADAAVTVYIFDNGRGCPAIVARNGLSGIRNRVEETGGQTRFSSAEGEGFQIFFEIPLHNKEVFHDSGSDRG